MPSDPISQDGLNQQPQGEEEDDYMTMVLPTEPQSKSLTSLERVRQKRRLAESRSHPQSRAETERQRNLSRAKALSSNLLDDTNNRGAKMLAKMGFKAGQALGRPTAPSPVTATDALEDRTLPAQSDERETEGDTDERITEPLRVRQREARVGLGADTALKRCADEALESQLVESRNKAARLNEGLDSFRSSVGAERDLKRLESMVWAAMKISEGLDADVDAHRDGAGGGDVDGEKRRADDNDDEQAVRKINVLYREVAQHRLEKQRGAMRKRELEDFASRLPVVDDREEDEDDTVALGTGEVEHTDTILDDGDDEQIDTELEEYKALPAAERLDRLVMYLHERHWYCFWCKCKYPDKEMEGCPGTDEDSHG